MTRAFCTLPNRLRNALEAEARREQKRAAKRARKVQPTLPPAASVPAPTTNDQAETTEPSGGDQ